MLESIHESISRNQFLLFILPRLSNGLRKVSSLLIAGFFLTASYIRNLTEMEPVSQ